MLPAIASLPEIHADRTASVRDAALYGGVRAYSSATAADAPNAPSPQPNAVGYAYLSPPDVCILHHSRVGSGQPCGRVDLFRVNNVSP